MQHDDVRARDTCRRSLSADLIDAVVLRLSDGRYQHEENGSIADDLLVVRLLKVRDDLADVHRVTWIDEIRKLQVALDRARLVQVPCEVQRVVVVVEDPEIDAR